MILNKDLDINQRDELGRTFLMILIAKFDEKAYEMTDSLLSKQSTDSNLTDFAKNNIFHVLANIVFDENKYINKNMIHEYKNEFDSF